MNEGEVQSNSPSHFVHCSQLNLRKIWWKDWWEKVDMHLFHNTFRTPKRFHCNEVQFQRFGMKHLSERSGMRFDRGFVFSHSMYVKLEQYSLFLFSHFGILRDGSSISFKPSRRCELNELFSWWSIRFFKWQIEHVHSRINCKGGEELFNLA